MKTKFRIGQDVWIIWCNEPRLVKVEEIKITRCNDVFYGISISGTPMDNRYNEEHIGATIEELKDKIFN